MNSWQTVSPFCFLTLLTGCFSVRKDFYLMWSHLSVFATISWVTGVLFRKSLYMYRKLSDVTLRPFIYFELNSNSIQDEQQGSGFSHLNVDIQLFWYHLLKFFFFFSMYAYGISIKNLITVAEWGLCSGSSTMILDWNHTAFINMFQSIDWKVL